MKILIFFLLIAPGAVLAQPDTIKLHFLYGSRPAKGFKKVERKVFGGIKGGHVSIEAKGTVLDFMPGNNPVLPSNNKPSGGFWLNDGLYWDSSGSKWATVLVPVSSAQMEQLLNIFNRYSRESPYDYAIFGMRCAAASYDVLGEIGLVKKISERNNVFYNFYPKLLRKRMLKWARQRNYTILYHEGKPSRKWESDKGLL